jgi:serine/threonine-protein kinase PknG
MESERLAPDPDLTVAGIVLEKDAIRLGLERAYRALARLTSSGDERFAFVDRANGVRPRTIV